MKKKTDYVKTTQGIWKGVNPEDFEEGITKKQIESIKCAYADLVGSYQTMQQQDYSIHDWQAHLTSIKDLEEAFKDIIEIVEIEEE